MPCHSFSTERAGGKETDFMLSVNSPSPSSLPKLRTSDTRFPATNSCPCGLIKFSRREGSQKRRRKECESSASFRSYRTNVPSSSLIWGSRLKKTVKIVSVWQAFISFHRLTRSSVNQRQNIWPKTTISQKKHFLKKCPWESETLLSLPWSFTRIPRRYRQSA